MSVSFMRLGAAGAERPYVVSGSMASETQPAMRQEPLLSMKDPPTIVGPNDEGQWEKFPVTEIVRYVSQFMVLRPGDVINTGRRPVSFLVSRDPRPYLRVGEVVEIEIDGLGWRRQQQSGQARGAGRTR